MLWQCYEIVMFHCSNISNLIPLAELGCVGSCIIIIQLCNSNDAEREVDVQLFDNWENFHKISCLQEKSIIAALLKFKPVFVNISLMHF